MLEDGQLRRTEAGTPQGGVISPLLANIYLHEVLDEWFDEQVKPRLRGRRTWFAMRTTSSSCLTDERDARRVMEVLPKRFARVRADAPPREDPAGALPAAAAPGKGEARRQARRPSTSWASRTTGVSPERELGGQTQDGAGSPDAGRSCGIASMVPKHRHQPIAEQQRDLVREAAGALRVLRDHRERMALGRFATQVRRIWQKWLSRRSQRGDTHVGPLPPAPGRYPLPHAGRPLDLPSRSESMSRGAGCGNSARPDLWGPGRVTARVYPTPCSSKREVRRRVEFRIPDSKLGILPRGGPVFGTLGMPELILIFVVALLLFGPRKMPQIGRSIGRAMGEFRRASNEFKRTIEDEVAADEIRRRRAGSQGNPRHRQGVQGPQENSRESDREHRQEGPRPPG